MDLYARRKNVNRIALTISVAAAAFGLMWLVLILWTLFYEGFNAIDWRIFSEMTLPLGAEGGLLNALFGSLAMTVVATLIGTPVGLLAGTYMAEYGKGTALVNVIRFINDILLSAPSIVIGLFIYEMMVVRMGHFSAWAGAMALAVIVVPVVVRTTEDMLNLVPTGLREAAVALGLRAGM